MSELDEWIESKSVMVLRGRLGGLFGETAIVIATLVVAVLARSFLVRHGVALLGGVFGTLAMFGAPAAAAIGLARRRRTTAGPGAIGVVGDDLVIVQGRKREQIPLARLVDGRFSPQRGLIDFAMTHGDRVIAHVASAADAERLLVAARLDASRRTMRFELGETTFLTWMTFLLGPALVLPATKAIYGLTPMPWGVFPILFIALLTLLYFLIRAAWGPAALVVGADGIVVDRPLRDSFIPFARLDSVTMTSDRVTALLRDGSRVHARARHLSTVQRGELRARLDAAQAAFHRGEGEAESLTQLDRGGRAIDAWREAMRVLLDRPSSYREATLTREQLLAVLESPAAPAERRLAAAVSLSAAGEAEIATKIRVAAEACARPQVRIALAAVADGDVDDAAIEAAIAEDEASTSRA